MFGARILTFTTIIMFESILFSASTFCYAFGWPSFFSFKIIRSVWVFLKNSFQNVSRTRSNKNKNGNDNSQTTEERTKNRKYLKLNAFRFNWIHFTRLYSLCATFAHCSWQRDLCFFFTLPISSLSIMKRVLLNGYQHLDSQFTHSFTHSIAAHIHLALSIQQLCSTSHIGFRGANLRMKKKTGLKTKLNSQFQHFVKSYSLECLSASIQFNLNCSFRFLHFIFEYGFYSHRGSLECFKCSFYCEFNLIDLCAAATKYLELILD